jgi:hypothetical protein
MLKKIAIAFAVLLAALVAVIASRPSSFHIERSASVAAPPAVVFPLLNDFHSWASWSPWEKLDPNMKREYSGAASGNGASYAWSGNDEVGSGAMHITESKAPQSVQIRLEFKKPFEATNTTLFELAPEAQGTKVTWNMDGPANFATKAMSLFMDMDQMIGKDFEQGLANLRAVAEAEVAKQKAAAAAAALAAPNEPAAASAPAPGASAQ